MSRGVFGWDLPPGVTQKMIDDAFGGDEEKCTCVEIVNERAEEFEKAGVDPDEALNRAEQLRSTGEIQCRRCELEAENDHPDPDLDWDDDR